MDAIKLEVHEKVDIVDIISELSLLAEEGYRTVRLISEQEEFEDNPGELYHEYVTKLLIER
jgi:hypothetical protein